MLMHIRLCLTLVFKIHKTTGSHLGNSLLYRNLKVEIEAVICLRFFHGKNKNMATSLMSGKNLKKFVAIFQKVQKNPSFD